MDYRGPGFLVVVLFGSIPILSTSISPVSKLDGRHTGRLNKRFNLLMGEGGRGGVRSQIIQRRESLVVYNIIYKKFISVYTVSVLILVYAFSR